MGTLLASANGQCDLACEVIGGWRHFRRPQTPNSDSMNFVLPPDAGPQPRRVCSSLQPDAHAPRLARDEFVSRSDLRISRATAAHREDFFPQRSRPELAGAASWLGRFRGE